MPRDTAGNYNLPAGNPVASGEIISASWANSTMGDLGQTLSASLDRYGRGGMLAPFQFTDGTESAPGATWTNEPTTGFYRAAYGDVRMSVVGQDNQRWTDTSSYLWRNGQWEEILTTSGGSGGTTINDLVVTGSFTSPGIDDNATSTAITIDASENVGIGQLNPSEALDVVGSIKGSKNLLLDSGSLSGFVQVSGNALQVGASTSGSVIDFYTENSQKVRIDASGNVGIGEDAPSSSYVVRYAHVTDPTSAGYLCENSAGKWATYVNTSGGYDIRNETSGNLAIRIDASGTTTVTGGFLAAQAGAGASAFAAGFSAGLTTQGQRSVAVGSYCAQTNQGEFSVALGDSAGKTNQNDFAVAVGHLAGNSGQLSGAVAIGYNAGTLNQQQNSIAIGNSAGSVNQLDHGVAVGKNAGKDSQGQSGIAIGYAAGQTTQGNFAIAVGEGSGATTQGTLAVALGYYAGVTSQGANSIAIGNRAGQTNQGANGIIINSSGVAKDVASANHIYLTSGTGKYLYYNGANSWELSGGDLVCSGNVTAYSDERLKDNVETLDGSKVYDMRGVSFTKDGEAGSGVIAQELQMVAPELVHEGEEYLSVAYGNLVGYLIEAVKDLKAEVEELKRAK